MPKETICPSCGAHVPLDPQDLLAPGSRSPRGTGTVEMVLPGTVSQSVGDLESVKVERVAPESVVQVSTSAAPKPTAISIAVDEEASSVSPPAWDAGSDSRDDVVSASRRGSSWWSVGLASYASAMTLACLWLWFDTRGASQTDWPRNLAPAPVDSRFEQGLRGERSRTVPAVAPVPSDRIVALGQSLGVGDLEWTPLAVTVEPVVLHRVGLDGRRETRREGTEALHLTMRLRNVSNDRVFAPLDEAFVRNRDHDLPDSFLDTDAGARIYVYPLAVESEWSIMGQTFQELRPGETFQTRVVSHAGAPDQLDGPITWRLRLRTGLDQTEVVAVRFHSDQIQRGADRDHRRPSSARDRSKYPQ